MNFEKYSSFFEDYENGVTVRPQKTVEFNFAAELKPDKKYRLFVVGETATYYLWKNEPDTPTLYRLLTDALDSDNANQDQFCLDLSCKKMKLTQSVFIKRLCGSRCFHILRWQICRPIGKWVFRLRLRT